VATAFAEGLGEARLRAAEFVDQSAVGLRLLQRRQVLALQILDQRDLERLRICANPGAAVVD
jgi:hypothetical protein